MNKKRIGLFFGSFNPVHVGHLALANYIVENSYIEQIWFVVSPQNPFKEEDELANTTLRLQMLEASVKGYPKFKICDIELNLPTPSYTYLTLKKLQATYPDFTFTIILGSDNLQQLHRWNNAQQIAANYSFMVYPRPGFKTEQKHLKIQLETIEAPVFNIDSTTIRKGIREGKNYTFMVPKEAYAYIVKKGMYKP
ncbi:nicotinate-nucleotide adenylyltransferase [Saccharicrinis carchari]|uniref:Probable nicotinate-nucleotide adenylyltransferase n=1 Tax=Saccharicrinis carchari TaxID=1168039 RepID=A0A521DT70_SACCC|nr:nicotinate (nicotinamide) nucleotide adenylyltransferase [Saccharicrinis carchari]SMO74311.1 nicotinate-nucleotide adenylyltransferase [Saccharicrinis carchari]